jgi:hypothetical protein
MVIWVLSIDALMRDRVTDRVARCFECKNASATALRAASCDPDFVVGQKHFSFRKLSRKIDMVA